MGFVDAQEVLWAVQNARRERQAGLAPPFPYSHHETCMYALLEGLAERVVALEERLEHLERNAEDS